MSMIYIIHIWKNNIHYYPQHKGTHTLHINKTQQSIDQSPLPAVLEKFLPVSLTPVSKTLIYPTPSKEPSLLKGKRGNDHIFVANILINQAKHLNMPLYTPFIDFQKAYDSVNCPHLLRKMVMCGLGPRFCQMIEHMYIQTSSYIKMGATMGPPFCTNVGVSQRDPLSPLLFNLYIVDLIFAFKSSCDPPTLHDLPVPSIQFADDTCNFSTSLHGIHNSINTTLQFC